MKNKLISILLTLCMVIVYVPTMAFAEGLNNVDNEQINDEELLAEEDLEEEEEESLSIEDGGYDEETEQVLLQIEDLQNSNIDFSSKRLIVRGSKKELKDEPVIANLNGIYLLQYDDYVDAIEAYSRLSEISDSVEFDSGISIASGGVGIVGVNGSDVPEMTEEENPFMEAKDITVEKSKYDVAVIDTGANEADKVVSVLGDDGIDKNGHGQKMIDTIKEYAPDAKILSIKAIDNNGYGNVSAVYSALRLAIDEKVDVINLSISALASEDNFIIEEIIAEAESKGITVVGAAGNNSIDASLTIPGKVEEATIVGTTSKISNTGDTVDYYVPTYYTSIATAIVTGLILSDTLKDYTITDKIIDIELDDEYYNNDNEENSTIEDEVELTEVPDSEFYIQDGAGSNGDGGSPTTGGDPHYTRARSGKTFVWWDRGQKLDADGNPLPQSSSGQGWFVKGAGNDGEGRWYKPDGTGSKKTESEFYTLIFFLDKIGAKSTFDGYSYKWGNNYAAGDRHKELRTCMKKACLGAIRRNKSNNKSARVVGVALTYIKFDDLRWGNSSNVWGDCWYIGSYNGSKKFEDMFKYPKNATGTTGLSSKYNWGKDVDPTKANEAQEGESWRHYAWRIGKEESAGEEQTGYGYQMWVVAVANDWPGGDESTVISLSVDKKSSITIPKLYRDNYSFEGAKYYIYDTQAQAQDAIDARDAGNSIPNTGRVKDTENDYIVLESDESGDCGTAEVPYDENDKTYWAVEIKAPTSKDFGLDNTPRKISATKNSSEDNPATATSLEPPVPSKITMHKKSGKTIPEANKAYYSLENAKYYLMDENGNHAKDINGEYCTFTTDANGKARETFDVWKGEYTIKEIEASKGFKIDTAIESQVIDLTGNTYVNKPYDSVSTEQPETAHITMHKVSGETIPEVNKKYYSLENASYKLLNEDGTQAKDVNGSTCTFTTNSNGRARETYEVFRGKYKIQEIIPSKGFKIDTNIVNQVINLTTKQSTDPAYDSTSIEEPDKIKIKIHKGVSSNGSEIVRNNPLYSIEGTSFAIYNTQADARAGTNAVKTFAVNSSGDSPYQEVYFGDYYLVETAIGRGLLIPDVLKKSNGGVLVICDQTKTINIP